MSQSQPDRLAELPRYQSGEEVLVQNLMMRRWGGGSIIPSGAYFSESPSTVLNAQGAVDGSALALLDEMVQKYAPESAHAPLSAMDQRR
jgi:hypothetical protein